ncbi:hypothetical protein ACFPLB_00215 [Aquamicrobium segne]|uniref:Transposase n=1 Tax=Aquamicrobium segne TaxID=469547 RepID=A0ABW0GSP8_9HYPH
MPAQIYGDHQNAAAPLKAPTILKSHHAPAFFRQCRGLSRSFLPAPRKPVIWMLLALTYQVGKTLAVLPAFTKSKAAKESVGSFFAVKGCWQRLHQAFLKIRNHREPITA